MEEKVNALIEKFHDDLGKLMPQGELEGVVDARNPNDELLMKLAIGNALMMVQVLYARSKPRIAKLATLINRDVNAHWDEYMDELYGPA